MHRLFAIPWLAAALALATHAECAGAGVVINEIMYHPVEDRDDLQFIELFNAGAEEADLAGWTFTKGVKFAFPADAKLAAGAFLVVCRNRAAFAQQHGEEIALAGEFDGRLSHDGERVELVDADGEQVDALKYDDAAPWPAAADGHASSLERICPFDAETGAANWAASKPPATGAAAGTPGRANDSFAPNLPPLINAIALTPAAPLPDEPATVRARVSDVDGVKEVTVSFQVGTPSSLSEETTVAMERITGDERSGVYRAAIPAQPEGCLVRYRIAATDGAGAVRSSPAPHDLRPARSYSTFVNNGTSKLASGLVLHPSGKPQRQRRSASTEAVSSPARGDDAFVYLPAGGGPVQTFDFVHARPRRGGYKIGFLKDQTLRGMTSINIISEFSPRFVLAEALAYEVYRLAGVPAELTEHVRLSVSGEERGFHLLVEQPNKSFLARNGRDLTGNLYKHIWYGGDLVGKHEKKTNLSGGHDDLVALHEGLTSTSGVAQWAFIEKHFNVEEFASYFAVNMCIQNWDGFHNNHFLYHDTGGSGRWEIYPWDEDKTWGDYDGASPKYDWYEMPLTYAMNGAKPPESMRARVERGEPFVLWWRHPGYFAGPMLANPQFRQRFLRRLREVCTTVFTKEKLFPIIDAMEKRLTDEVPFRARVTRQDSDEAVARFRSDMQSFRNQVINRRKFILAELDKASP